MFRNIVYNVRCFRRLSLCGVVGLVVVNCSSTEGMVRMEGKVNWLSRTTVVLKALGHSLRIGGAGYGFQVARVAPPFLADMYGKFGSLARNNSVDINGLGSTPLPFRVAALNDPLVRGVVAVGIATNYVELLKERGKTTDAMSVLQLLPQYTLDPRVKQNTSLICAIAASLPTGTVLWLPKSGEMFCSGPQAGWGIETGKLLK
jgi:hypothetical protein